MHCKERLERYFHDAQVPFEEQEHRVAYTAQRVAAAEHVAGKFVAKVVVLIADGQPVMVTLPATMRVDLTRIAAMLRAKSVRLAEEDEFATIFPDCELGAMPPFGNFYGVPVYVDRALAEDEQIIFPAGTHTDTMSIAYADFARLVRPTVGAFAYR
jgi:Ala-tRNA(Pro) deacylase